MRVLINPRHGSELGSEAVFWCSAPDWGGVEGTGKSGVGGMEQAQGITRAGFERK